MSYIIRHIEYLIDSQFINMTYLGPLENVDELPSNTNYYDGSLNLNVA